MEYDNYLLKEDCIEVRMAKALFEFEKRYNINDDDKE